MALWPIKQSPFLYSKDALEKSVDRLNDAVKRHLPLIRARIKNRPIHQSMVECLTDAEIGSLFFELINKTFPLKIRAEVPSNIAPELDTYIFFEIDEYGRVYGLLRDVKTAGDD
ncbi:MAG: hypothetical protein DWQ19_10150 [Crenarchaeota archaeon]|nr:MAG: hypothetical protein DWQ19_10150 [Thermoproteota archaeon]